VRGTQPEEWFGIALAGRGDVNGDGYADIVVGSPNFIGAVGLCGKAALYLGGPAGPTSAPAWVKEGSNIADYFGYRVAMLDFDADGYSDVAVACQSNSPVSPHVDIFYGGPTGLSQTKAFSLFPVPASGTYASAIAGVGDWNCDGVADLVVSATDEGGSGAIYWYPGSRSRSNPQNQVRKYVAPAGNGMFGAAIAGGADLDGDGRADFVVGAPQASHPEQSEGRLFVFHGRPSAQGEIAPDETLELDVADQNLGASVVMADLTGDGYADILAGSTANGAGTGSVHGWFGGGEGTMQYVSLSDLSGGQRYAPSLLDSTHKVGFATVYRSAAGRTLTQAQFEIRTLSEPFTNAPNFRDAPFLTADTWAPASYGSAVPGGSYIWSLWQNVAYHMRTRTTTGSPHFPHSRWITPEGRLAGDHDFRTGGTTVGLPPRSPSGAMMLARPAPNPSRGTVALAFEIPARVPMRLDVYDLKGRHVRTLADEPAFVGPGSRAWDGTDTRGVRVPPGLYFVELRAGDRTDRTRVVRLE
jgi:hypothetical protein